MAFKNLEKRFNETTDKLYAGAKTKFDGGRASTGRNDDPLIVREPGDGYWSFAESRSTPVASATNDVKRMTLFTVSTRGLKFLAKQQLLQTGNTFEATRLLNPAFHISNAVPFIHTKRAIGVPITGRGIARALLGNNAITNRIFGSGALNAGSSNSISRGDLTKVGQLQETTYNRLSPKSGLHGVNNAVRGLIGKIPVIGKVASAATAKRSIGESKPYEESRPELANNNPANSGGLLGKVAGATIRAIGNSIIPGLGTIATAYEGGYVMIRQLGALKQTWHNKQKIQYEPKYKPTVLNGQYATYTNLSDKERKWEIGQSLNHYTRLRKRVLDKVGTERIDFPKTDNLIVRLSPDAKGHRLAVTYNSSMDKEIIDGNIKFDRYVDYGSAEKYERTPTLPGLTELRPKVIEDKKVLEQKYDSTSSLETLAFEIKQDEYINETLEPTLGQIPTYLIGDAASYVKYFTYGEGTVTLANSDAIKDGVSTNAQSVALGSDFKRRKISYIKDLSNFTSDIKDSKITKEAYTRINNDFDDPIVVSFAMGKDAHVRFRAYLRDLTQNTTPQYNPLQYIGRMEKFIYYTGVQREVSFKLGLVAFSPDELDGVWRRINYLTGMAYPYGFNKGIFQPNIIRMTIGDVYTDQPAYITSLNTNFTELTETWELSSGQQVPISATVSMTFVLIEKASRVADSPFYGITENLDGFSKNIPTAGKDAGDTSQAPSPGTPDTVNVNSRDMQGFDAVDRNMTQGILAAAARRDNATVSNIGSLQARRREAARQGRPF